MCGFVVYQEVGGVALIYKCAPFYPVTVPMKQPKEQCITEHTIPMMRTTGTVVAIGALVWDVAKTG